MIIDAHVHFWQYDPLRDEWMNAMPVLQKDYLPYDLKAMLNDVEGCVAVQAAQSEAETLFLCGLAKENPFIKGIVGWIDLQDNTIEERLEYFSGFDSIKGWRHIVQAEQEGFLLSPGFQNGIRALAAYKYVYDVLIYPSQLKETLELLSVFPDQKFVIDHCAKPKIAAKEIKDWSILMKELAKLPNVYCKLSGLLTEAKTGNREAADIYPYFDLIFEAFETSRIMFGSDWPVLNTAGDYTGWKQMVTTYLQQFSKEAQANVMGETAMQFYSL